MNDYLLKNAAKAQRDLHSAPDFDTLSAIWNVVSKINYPVDVQVRLQREYQKKSLSFLANSRPFSPFVLSSTGNDLTLAPIFLTGANSIFIYHPHGDVQLNSTGNFDANFELDSHSDIQPR